MLRTVNTHGVFRDERNIILAIQDSADWEGICSMTAGRFVIVVGHGKRLRESKWINLLQPASAELGERRRASFLRRVCY